MNMTFELASTGVVLDPFMDDGYCGRGPRKGPGRTGKVYRQHRRAHGRFRRRQRALDRQANDHFRHYREMAKFPPIYLGWGEDVEFYPVETIVYSPVDWDEEQRKQDDVWRRIRQQGYVDIVTGGGVVRATVDTGDDG